MVVQEIVGVAVAVAVAVAVLVTAAGEVAEAVSQ